MQKCKGSHVSLGADGPLLKAVTLYASFLILKTLLVIQRNTLRTVKGTQTCPEILDEILFRDVGTVVVSLVNLTT